MIGMMVDDPVAPIDLFGKDHSRHGAFHPETGQGKGPENVGITVAVFLCSDKEGDFLSPLPLPTGDLFTELFRGERRAGHNVPSCLRTGQTFPPLLLLADEPEAHLSVSS